MFLLPSLNASNPSLCQTRKHQSTTLLTWHLWSHSTDKKQLSLVYNCLYMLCTAAKALLLKRSYITNIRPQQKHIVKMAYVWCNFAENLYKVMVHLWIWKYFFFPKNLKLNCFINVLTYYNFGISNTTEH